MAKKGKKKAKQKTKGKNIMTFSWTMNESSYINANQK